MGDLQLAPIWFAFLERDEELAVAGRHLANDLGDELLTCFQQILEPHRLGGHACEALGKLT